MSTTHTNCYPQKMLRISLIFIVFSSLLLAVACRAPESEIKETPVIEQEGLKTETDSEPVLETTAVVTELGNEKLFVWWISSESGGAFLMGSVHLGNDAIYPLDSSIEEAFEMANNLVVEVDMSNVDTITTTQLLMEYGTYPEGDGLKGNLSEDLYNRLNAIFGELGISILMMDRFRPWVISTLIEEMQVEEMGYSAEYGIDMYFIKKVKEETKNIIELETAEYQLELLSSFSDELMIAVIEDIVDHPSTQEDMDRLFNAWEDGDIILFESVVFDDIADTPMFEPYYDKVYNERNYKMAEKIEEFIADDQVYFIIVGAAHLVGEEGLLSILEDRGYEVTQLLRRGN